MAVKALDNVIRTKSNGCYQKVVSPAWGSFYQKIEDPLGKDIDIDALFEEFKLRDDFPKIPAPLWARWLNLCYELCDPGNRVVDETTEVTAVFVRTGENYNEWRILIPRQVVGSIEARASFKEFVDIDTGEEYEGFPERLAHAGSTHSHNEMDPFFSLMDDKYELDVPGLHVVVGNLEDTGKKRTYNLEASIVMRKRRMKIAAKDVIDLTPVRGAEFHPKCLDYIKKIKPPVVTRKPWEDKELDSKRFKGLFGSGDTKPRFWKSRDKDDDDILQLEREMPFEKTDCFLALSKEHKKKFLEIKDELEVLSKVKKEQVKDALYELLLRYAY